MEIVKAFNSNDLHANITIKGTYNEPLFRASDIGEILKINNIRMSIQHFNETEKDDVSTTDSTGRNHGIGQFNLDGQLVKEFVCKYDCIKQLTMSDKTLAKALDKNIAYNGSYFKSIGAKVSAI
jgi:hypothetical protein